MRNLKIVKDRGRPVRPSSYQKKELGPRHSDKDKLCAYIDVKEDDLIFGRYSRNPWERVPSTPIGTVIKVINTASIEEDGRAAEVVEAELDRLRGEMGDATLKAVQLKRLFIFESQYIPDYAIYRPVEDGPRRSSPDQLPS